MLEKSRCVMHTARTSITLWPQNTLVGFASVLHLFISCDQTRNLEINLYTFRGVAMNLFAHKTMKPYGYKNILLLAIRSYS